MRLSDTPGVLVGNVYDKYGTKNPVAHWLMRGFLNAVTALYRRAAASSVLEVGCGEGLLARHLLTQGSRPERFDACDLELTRLTTGLDPLLRFREASIYELPWDDGEFELVVCCEVLEHLADPLRGLHELARVSRRAVLLSTPREPLWRALNLLRGSYWPALGNTPGHVQHFGRGGLCRLASHCLDVQETRTPIPWTVLLGAPRTRQARR